MIPLIANKKKITHVTRKTVFDDRAALPKPWALVFLLNSSKWFHIVFFGGNFVFPIVNFSCPAFPTCMAPAGIKLSSEVRGFISTG